MKVVNGVSDKSNPTGVRTPRLRLPRAALGLLFAGLLAGCSTAPDGAETAAVNDPLEPMNRYFFDVNDAADKLLLRPVSEIYRGVVPGIARDGVRNALRNLKKPVILVNDLLQGETDRAGRTAGSFVVNSTVGLLGVLDLTDGPDSVTGLDWPYHDEDFGQTLAVWGAEEGPYLVLPLIGPSPPRHTVGRVVDSFMDPWSYLIASDERFLFSAVRFGLNGVDQRSRNIETLDDIERSSIDFYATVRSLYRQSRARAIANDAGVEDELPKLDMDMTLDDDEPAPSPQAGDKGPAQGRVSSNTR